MTITIINKTIRTICQELMRQRSQSRNWYMMTEEELLYEVSICIFGSQMLFEMAVAMADRLREWKLLQPTSHATTPKAIWQCFVCALSDPLPIINSDGVKLMLKPRFKKRLAFLLATTIKEIYGQSRTIRDFLYTASHAKEARELLIQHVWGFGPKQASLFLRRVGYSDDLAVLDIHVIDYLQMACGISLSRNKLSCLTFYEEIEDIFRTVAAQFGHSVGCVDFATWLTMRVAKREAFI